MKKILLLNSLILFSPAIKAQTDRLASIPVDGFYNQSNASGATPFEYPSINPTDVQFFKRIWRDLSLKNEKNLILNAPDESLIEVLVAGIKSGKITAYDGANDSFKYPISAKAAFERLTDSVLVPVFDQEGNLIKATLKQNDFDPARIVAFRIKEDVFFDKVRSVVETRIIGIAPIMEIEMSDKLPGETPAFWVYYPACRKVLATKEISDPDRGIDNMTLDDFFIQRKFQGKIIKESSPTDQRIVDYVKDAEEQDREAQRIEASIENFKNKMCGYNKK